MRLPKRGSIVHKVASSLFDAVTDSGDQAASEASKRPGAVKTAVAAATGGAIAVVAASAAVSSMRRRGGAGDDG